MLELRRALPFLAFPVVAFALALAVSACDAALAPSPSPSPSAAAVVDPTPVPTATPTASPTPEPTKRSRLNRARDRWAESGISNYRITLTYGCFCEFGDGREIKVRVEDGRFAEASSDGQPLTRRELRGFAFTVEQLFDLVASHRNADKLEVAYDKTLGYPRSIDIDNDARADDDELRVEVVKLVPLDTGP